MGITTRLTGLVPLRDPARSARRKERQTRSAAIARNIQRDDPRGDLAPRTGRVGGAPDRYQGRL